MEICKECGAVCHGNLFCDTCRTEMNKRFGLSLPLWPYPAERPCGVEEVKAFMNKLAKANGEEPVF